MIENSDGFFGNSKFVSHNANNLPAVTVNQLTNFQCQHGFRKWKVFLFWDHPPRPFCPPQIACVCSNTLSLDMQESPYTSCSIFQVFIAVFPSLTQNLTLILCSVVILQIFKQTSRIFNKSLNKFLLTNNLSTSHNSL